MAIRHFLTLRDLTTQELNQVIQSAIEIKAAYRDGRQDPVFKGKVLAMIFEKSSTRTRVSFEAAWHSWVVTPYFCPQMIHSSGEENLLKIRHELSPEW